VRRLLAFLLLLVALAGFAVRFTVRDSVDSLALVFYVLPLPVLGALLLASGILARRRLRRLIVVLGLVTLATWFIRDYGFASPRGGDWKVLTWNLGGMAHPVAPLIEIIRKETPDFVALMEFRNLDENGVNAYERQLPGYRMKVLGGKRACLVRNGVINDAITATLPGRSRVVTLRAKIRVQDFRILLEIGRAHV
jgi:endonuclease/exonuclease/phosphatase (EEP) superfamily protein YafD